MRLQRSPLPMIRCVRIAPWLVTVLMVAGCLGTYQTWPEQVYLCRVETANGWTESAVRSSRPPHGVRENTLTTRVVAGVTYRFRAREARYPVQRPVPDMFWVAVDWGARGSHRRTSPTADRKASQSASVRYDPLGAALRINARTVPVTRAWAVRTDFSVSPTQHHWRELVSPVNWHERQTRTVYLAFAIPKPAVSDRYVFLPGAVSIDGTTIALPTSRSCYAPRQRFFKQAIS